MSGLIDPKQTIDDAKRIGLIFEAADEQWRNKYMGKPKVELPKVKLPAEAGIAAIHVAQKADRRSRPKPPKTAACKKRYVITKKDRPDLFT